MQYRKKIGMNKSKLTTMCNPSCRVVKLFTFLHPILFFQWVKEVHCVYCTCWPVNPSGYTSWMKLVEISPEINWGWFIISLNKGTLWRTPEQYTWRKVSLWYNYSCILTFNTIVVQSFSHHFQGKISCWTISY